MENLCDLPERQTAFKQTEVGGCMRGRGSVILEADERLEVHYEVNEQRRHLPTGSGTWLASVKSYVGTINPVPSASPKPYTLELSNGQRIRFRSDGTTVTFSGELFSGDES
jgi:hypothetical protein